MKEENSTLRRRLNFCTKRTCKRKLEAKEQECSRIKDELQAAAEKNRRLQKERDHFRAQLRKMQLNYADLKRKLNRVKEKLKRKEQELQEEPQANVTNAEESPVLHLKDERGYFEDEAVVCVMQLVGEHEVPPGRCGAVIQTVAKNILKATISGSNLPSVRSAERFVDRGHVIGKIHVAETLLQWENWDLHTDGTSRCGKKYVCRQMTVGSKTVFTGFTSVGTENAFLGECQQSCVTVLLS